MWRPGQRASSSRPLSCRECKWQQLGWGLRVGSSNTGGKQRAGGGSCLHASVAGRQAGGGCRQAPLLHKSAAAFSSSSSSGGGGGSSGGSSSSGSSSGSGQAATAHLQLPQPDPVLLVQLRLLHAQQLAAVVEAKVGRLFRHHCVGRRAAGEWGGWTGHNLIGLPQPVGKPVYVAEGGDVFVPTGLLPP